MAEGPSRDLVGSYNLAREAILRLMALVYVFAFAVAYFQNPGLISSKGLMPFQAPRASQFSLFHLVAASDENLDRAACAGLVIAAILVLFPATLDISRTIGATGSVARLLFSGCDIVAAALPWIIMYCLYTSILQAGESSTFFEYGWESQILETGLLAVFLAAGGPWNLRGTPWISWVTLWLCRWLILRISLGAGLIKFRGDGCWHERTCLWYHFETQPIPNMMSNNFHFLPRSILSFGVDVDFLVQLRLVWLCVLPDFPWLPRIFTTTLRYLRAAGGLVQIAFMLNIALSGNLSFLNLLTAIPAFSCIDDEIFRKCPRAFFRTLEWPQDDNTTAAPGTEAQREKSSAAEESSEKNVGTTESASDDNATAATGTEVQRENPSAAEGGKETNVPAAKVDTEDTHTIRGSPPNSGLGVVPCLLIFPAFVAYLAAVIYLSMPVIENLLSQRQVMNASFGPAWLRQLRVLNTYGAFGSVGKGRYEPVVMLQFEKGEFEKHLLAETNGTTDDDDGDDVNPVVHLFETFDREGFTLKSKRELFDDGTTCRNVPDQDTDSTADVGNMWFEVEFKCKPTLLSRRPCTVAPYQHRLDWNIWFTGFIPGHEKMLHGRERWLFPFLDKLLQNDKTVLSLLADIQDCGSECINTWLNKDNFPTPKRARVEMYHYWFARDGPEPVDPDRPLQWPPREHVKPTDIAGVGDVHGKTIGSKMLWWNRAWSSTLVPPVGRKELRP
eukprot:CAMPEP_0194508668 /NCGR_PEP_ID=MMETSP0253-20130528/39048_1 /TAXON_ID=2966 /ORGANISM="Noctiluca scintillans" /LENGTH=727 /DNA_ID=CAMNT_0039351735 /DNA_START=64 /DNA_END=2244 /DNA_ORIENTATION=+